MHTNNVADVTATSTLCKTSRGGPDALAGWIWTPSRLFVSPVPTETPSENCFYSKRKNDLFRPSENTRLVWSGPVRPAGSSCGPNRTCDVSPLINNYKNLRTNLNRLFQKAHLTLLLVVSLDWSRPPVCVRARACGWG